MTKTPLLGMTLGELQDAARSVGAPAYVGKQLAQWIYQHRATHLGQMTNLALRVREALGEAYHVGASQPLTCQSSADGTVKYLYAVAAGGQVESVYIPDGKRATLCVSSQVGCKMACRFCMTGRQGFHGHLTAADILNQAHSLPQADTLTNMVLMGQGEPLDNTDAVLRATELMTAPYGWAWSPKRITVSTVGTRHLARFLDQSQCHLAVSLHNPFAEERAEMMPAERGYSVQEFMPLLRGRDWSGQRRLSFEYTMLAGVNDTPRHARELARLLSGLECRVNLIRWHSIPDAPYRGSDDQTVQRMADYLNRHRITTTIRASRGEDILAACGLLSTKQT